MLIVMFQGGARAGERLQFDADKTEVVFGRDPETCDVVFESDQTKVGRLHCSLIREAGAYRLTIPGDNHVSIDGEQVRDGMLLPAACDLQLGPGGPKLVLEVEGGGGDLPATEAQGPASPGAETRVEQVQGQVASSRRFLLVVILLVAVAGAFGLSDLRGDVEGLSLVKTELAPEQSGRIESLEREMRALEASEGEQLEALSEDLRKIREEVRASVADAIAKAKASVCLVMVQASSEHEAAPQGTAWVVGPGLLATNAHVVEGFDAREKGSTWLVRSSGDAKDFVISEVTIHPGYAAFQELWVDYKPSREQQVGMEQWQDAELNPIAACDVALIRVEGADGLPAPLELAGEEDMDALTAGQQVFFLGYPMENLALGGVNPAQPEPQAQVGHLTAVTNYFLAKSVNPGDNLLLQHNLPATGGASGSPLFSKDGKVVGVLSAVNFFFLQEVLPGVAGRIPSAVGVNFAQRGSLVQELLGGDWETAQQGREVSWREQIQTLKSGKINPTQLLESYRDNWAAQVGGTPEELLRVRAKTEPGPSGPAFTREVVLRKPGQYMFIAVALDGTQDIDLWLFEGRQELAKDVNSDSFPLFAGPIQVKGERRLSLTVNNAEAEFVLAVFRIAF